MQDLSVINKQNAQATAESIPAERAAGKFVLATYVGLHFFGHTSYDTRAEAQAKLDEIVASNTPGERYQLLEPTATAQAEYTPSGDAPASLGDVGSAIIGGKIASKKTKAAATAEA